METLDWGQVTPELANIDGNEFVYVYNHDLTSPDKIDRTIRFIIGRLNHYDTHLPKAPKHIIKIDTRGQKVSDSMCELIRNEILVRYPRAFALTVNIIK